MQVDTREKTPITFPANIRIQHPERAGMFVVLPVAVQKAKLDYGDYRLKEFPTCCVIERKASQLELFKNVVEHKDSIRQAKAFRRLSACEYPYLLVEERPTELFKVSAKIRQPDIIIGRLSIAIAKYGLNLLWIPWGNSPHRRKLIGEIILHVMLGCAIHKKMDILPVLV